MDDEDKVTPFQPSQPAIVGYAGGRVDEFTASLRVFGDDLDPPSVTAALGCVPTGAERKGELVDRGRRRIVAKTGSWRLESRLPRSADLAEHLKDILTRVSGDPAVWKDLAKRFRVDLFCGVFLNAWNRGFEIPPELLEAIGQRRLRIGFDIYSNEEPSLP